MADTQKVTERLARLEVAVSQGFFEAKNDRRTISAKVDALLENVASLSAEIHRRGGAPQRGALLGAPQRGQDSQQARAARDPEEAPDDDLCGVAIQRAADAEQRGVDEGAAEDPAEKLDGKAVALAPRKGAPYDFI
jgi:hypothetical protein